MKKLFAIVLMLALLLCGCANHQTTQPNDTLTYVINADIDDFNPYTNQLLNYVSFFTFNCYEPLFHLNEKMEYEMDLATKYTVIDDTTYQFDLRQDVKFHNGDAFTAADVIHTINYVKNPDNGCYKQSYFANVAELTANGDYQLTIKLSAPTPAFLDALAWLPITCKRVDIASETTNPIGTGAFKFDSWTPNDSIRLSKFQDYYDAEKIKFSSVVIKPYSDYTVALNGLYAGDVDFVSNITVDNATALDTSKGTKVIKAESSNLMYLFEVGTHNVEAFRDENVMKAMSLVLDKAAINEHVFGSLGKVPTSPFPSASRFHKDVYTGGYDLEQAKSLMAASDYANGFEFEVMVLSGDTYSEMASVIWKQELAKIGITMNINVCEISVWLDAYLGRTYDMICNYYSMVGADPATFCTVILAPYADFQLKDNPEFFELVNNGASTTDEATRQNAYNAIQEAIAKTAPVISYAEAPQLAAAAGSLNGIVINPMGHVFLKGATK